MAGQHPGFDPNEFRGALRFVFGMAATPISDDQVTFRFEPNLVYVGNLDDDDVPFDPEVTVQQVPVPPVQVPCAVEYLDAENQPTTFGLIAPSRVRVTLLDEDYAKVRTAKYIVIAGDRYNYRRTEPPSGLFDVGLWVMHFAAENET